MYFSNYICEAQQPPNYPFSGLLTPRTSVYVGNRFIFMFMLTLNSLTLPAATALLWEVRVGNLKCSGQRFPLKIYITSGLQKNHSY